MWRKRLRNSAVRIASMLGFLDKTRATEAESAIERVQAVDPECSADLLLKLDYLTPSQARVVAFRQRQENPEEVLEEKLKTSTRVQNELTDSIRISLVPKKV